MSILKSFKSMRNLWQALSIFALLASASCGEQTAAASREWWHGLVGAFAGAVVFLFVGYAFVTTDADLREGHLRPYQSNYLALWRLMTRWSGVSSDTSLATG